MKRCIDCGRYIGTATVFIRVRTAQGQIRHAHVLCGVNQAEPFLSWVAGLG